MRLAGFFSVGIIFGIILSKSEAISWYRIHEMFRFESFHMYGIIGVAVVLGIAMFLFLKKTKMKTLKGTLVDYKPMKLNAKRHIIAGSIFGLGWAMMGACPGPMFIMLGQGFAIFIVAILGALIGTMTYAAVRHKLPH